MDKAGRRNSGGLPYGEGGSSSSRVDRRGKAYPLSRVHWVKLKDGWGAKGLGDPPSPGRRFYAMSKEGKSTVVEVVFVIWSGTNEEGFAEWKAKVVSKGVLEVAPHQTHEARTEAKAEAKKGSPRNLELPF